MSEETVSQDGSKGWKKFFKKHWNMVALFVVAVILLSTWAVYAFLWFVGVVQSSGLVPSTLGLWTMGNMISFILHVVFWELVLVGIPVATPRRTGNCRPSATANGPLAGVDYTLRATFAHAFVFARGPSIRPRGR